MVSNMRKCLETLISIVERDLIDLKKTKLVMLTGERMLFKTKEGYPWEQKELFKLLSESIDPEWNHLHIPPATEDQALKWIWSQTKTPPSLRNVPLIWIVAPQRIDPQRKLVRPNTRDTIELFLD
jgi:hypothetical protein